MSNPLVTILTPVYNGANYLRECIESVLGQTYSNWDYFIADNCSSDETPEIAKSFAEVDPRVKYIRYEEFVDVVASFNRTFGLVGSDSSYCKVIGADDWIFPECLERMVDLARRNPTVGLVSAYRLLDRHVDLTGIPYSTSVMLGEEILRKSLLFELSVFGGPSATLLRSDLVRQRNPFYDTGFRHADTEAAHWVVARSDFGYVHQVLSFERAQSDQTMISTDLGSWSIDRTLMLMRYGPGVIERQQYRELLHQRLREYVSYHVKQRIKPSRRRDRAFHDFHHSRVQLLRALAGEDPVVPRAAALVDWLLRT